MDNTRPSRLISNQNIITTYQNYTRSRGSRPFTYILTDSMESNSPRDIELATLQQIVQNRIRRRLGN